MVVDQSSNLLSYWNGANEGQYDIYDLIKKRKKYFNVNCNPCVGICQIGIIGLYPVCMPVWLFVKMFLYSLVFLIFWVPVYKQRHLI